MRSGRAGALSSLAVIVLSSAVHGDLIAQRAGATTKQVAKHQVDSVAAARGRKVWKSKQCYGCHEFGRSQSTGPDLLGVTDRRSREWLRKWLKNPVDMAQADSTAAALKKQYNSQMPNLKLSGEEVDALINYLAQQTQEHRAGR